MVTTINEAFRITTLTSGLLILAMGCFVYLKNKKSMVNISFSLLNLSSFIWLFGYFMLFITIANERLFNLWSKIIHFGVTFIPIFAHQFVVNFIGKEKERTNKRIIFFSYLIAGIFIILLASSGLYIVGGCRYVWGPYVKAGPFHPFFIVLFFYLYFRSLVLLYIEMKNNKRNVHRYIKIKYVLLALLVAVIGAIDFIPLYTERFHAGAHIFLVPFALMITYAIVKHQLLDINIVIRRTIIYSSLITILTVTYLLVVLVAERFSSHFFGYTTLPMTIVTASIIAIAFIPIKNKIQYIVDRLFFKGTLDSLAKEKALMHQELMRSERLKAVATLAAGMAHEIKNPLTAIKTFTEHLKEKKDDSEFIAKFERIVGGEVDKINNLVHSLLDFAKPNPLKLESIDLKNILEDTLVLLSDKMLARKIYVDRRCPTLPPIQADRNQLKQAFLNLMLNAIEAMPNGGKLTLDISINKTCQIEVRISDTGGGIPKKELPHIFDPFFSTKETGTGLGLSITHEIIKKHNGTITVESELGEGTAVKIILWSEVEN